MRFIWNLLKISVILFFLALIFCLVGAIVEIIREYWIWLVLTALIIVICYCLYKNPNYIKRKRKPPVTLVSLQEQNQIPEIATAQEYKDFPETHVRKKKPTVTLASLQKQEHIPEIATEQEYMDFLETHVLIRSFITKVVGVTHLNDDGSDRQDILSRCLIGESVVFNWYTFRGAPACAVISEHGQIGHLNAELAADLNIDYGAGNYVFTGKISDILGGEDGLNYGCHIMISIYGSA